MADQRKSIFTLFPNYESKLGDWITEKRAEEASNITITNLVVKDGKSIDTLNKQIIAEVTLSGNGYIKVEITIDGKTYPASFNNSLTTPIIYSADVIVTFKTVVALEETFKITAVVTDLSTNKVTDTKTINVKVDNEGNVGDKKNELKKDIKLITYHIYWNNETEGKIEKYIPSNIEKGYEDKIKYIYHDKNAIEYDIATLEFHETVKKANGKKIDTIPNNSEIVSDEYIKEGQTERRVTYKNGDIAEYGINKGQFFWLLYKAIEGNITLVRMPDSLNISKINIGYNFEKTRRRYCSPDCFAGFIGALAELNRIDIVCTGMCFRYGSSFPSVSHPNGISVDSAYFASQEEEQLKVNAFRKFYFSQIISGKKGWHSLLKTEIHDPNHDDHLHCGKFLTNKIINIK